MVTVMTHRIWVIFILRYGDGENKERKDDQPKSFYDEDEKFWMDYEEDDEANAKGRVGK